MVKYVKATWSDFQDWQWFICNNCGKVFKANPTYLSESDEYVMPNCPYCATHRYKDCDNNEDGYANKDVHFFDTQNNEVIYTDYKGATTDKHYFGDTYVKSNTEIFKSPKEEAEIRKALDMKAYEFYKAGNQDAFYDFSKEDLIRLWAMCLLTDENPYGQAYDDEVYDAIYSLGNYGVDAKEIFNQAEEYYDQYMRTA